MVVASSETRSRWLRNLHRHRDEPQVGRERRLGEQLDGQLVNLDFQLVHDDVVGHDAPGEFVVALDQRLDGLGDGASAWLAMVRSFSFSPASSFSKWMVMGACLKFNHNGKISTKSSGDVILRLFLRAGLVKILAVRSNSTSSPR
jgi:hypothetical protein